MCRKEKMGDKKEPASDLSFTRLALKFFFFPAADLFATVSPEAVAGAIVW